MFSLNLLELQVFDVTIITWIMELNFLDFYLIILCLELLLISLILMKYEINDFYFILGLILLFVSAANFIIIVGVPFLGLTLLIIYVGAISILFIFLIMTTKNKVSITVSTSISFTIKKKVKHWLFSYFKKINNIQLLDKLEFLFDIIILLFFFILIFN